jgi:hypothetical protein
MVACTLSHDGDPGIGSIQSVFWSPRRALGAIAFGSSNARVPPEARGVG